MVIFIKNIKSLINVENIPKEKASGIEMANMQSLDNAWISIRNDEIIDFGLMGNLDENKINFSGEKVKTINAEGKMVMPAFVDSHTHLVFPDTREKEYVYKIKGLSYEEIAKRGGGILNSSRKMKEISIEELFLYSYHRAIEAMRWGTGALEIKSGYGLSWELEKKMLLVIQQLKKVLPIPVKATFLGAHAVPEQYKSNPDKYVDIVVNEMIPKVSEEKLADFIDVFCDRGFFTVAQTERILAAGQQYGLRAKIHANELDFSGGVQVGVKYNALSVDHLEYLGDDELRTLSGSKTMPTVLPGAAFFLGLKLAPARKIIDKGLPLAMATDFNPGSSPSGNMQIIVSMASILYHMLPEEAITATTLNTAYALGLSNKIGSIAKGKKANLIITKKIPSIDYIPYAYGENKLDLLMINGEFINFDKIKKI